VDTNRERPSESCACYLGHPFRKLAICTSLIFLCCYFPLVNDREKRGMANISHVCLKYVGRYLANQANTQSVYLVRKVSTRAVKRKHRIRLAPVLATWHIRLEMKQKILGSDGFGGSHILTRMWYRNAIQTERATRSSISRMRKYTSSNSY